MLAIEPNDGAKSDTHVMKEMSTTNPETSKFRNCCVAEKGNASCSSKRKAVTGSLYL